MDLLRVTLKTARPGRGHGGIRAPVYLLPVVSWAAGHAGYPENGPPWAWPWWYPRPGVFIGHGILGSGACGLL